MDKIQTKLFELKIKLKIWWNGQLINIGANLIRRGTLYRVGQPIKLPKGYGPALNSAKTKVWRNSATTYWVKNIFFNFKDNCINYSWSDKPIKGLSEKFTKKNEQKG